MADESRGTMGFAATTLRLRCIREALPCIPCLAVAPPPPAGSEKSAAVFSSAAPLLFLSRVAMFGQQQQTRCPARWVRLLRRPQQAEKQAAGLTNRRRTLPCSRPIRAQVRSRGTGAPHLVAAKGTLRAISGPHFEALPWIFGTNLSMFENQTRVNSEENI